MIFTPDDIKKMDDDELIDRIALTASEHDYFSDVICKLMKSELQDRYPDDFDEWELQSGFEEELKDYMSAYKGERA